MQSNNLVGQDDTSSYQSQQEAVPDAISQTTPFRTVNPDGSTSFYDQSGSILETDFTDGSRKILDGPDSIYTATYYNPDGSFSRYEADLPGGYAYYDANGKPLEFDFAVGGSKVTFASNGAAVQTNVDGTTLSYALDGTITIRNPLGNVIQIYAADHSWKSVTSNGWNYYSAGGTFVGSETDASDGTDYFYDANGRLSETKYASGSYIVSNVDGSVSRYSAAGQLTEVDAANGVRRLFLPPASGFTVEILAGDGSFLRYETDLPGGTAYYGADGKPTEFDYAAGGSVVLFAPDGSAVQTNLDGSQIDYHVDGTATVFDRSGAVVQVYATDHSWKSPVQGGWSYYSAAGDYLGKALTDAGGTVNRYDASGRLTESDAVNGTKILHAADGSQTCLDASGNTMEIDFANGSRQISDPVTGNTLLYSASGSLLQTTYQDGSKRVLGGPGSQFNATWFAPNGAFLKYEADLSGGTGFYDSNGKPLEFDFAVGGSVVKFEPNGSSVQTNLDGTTLAYALDGTVTVDDPSGKTTQVYAADHSWKSVTDNGWNYYSPTQVFLGSEVDEPDGDKRLYDASGRPTETDLAVGGKIVYESDGQHRFNASGALVETDFTDGTREVVQQGTDDVLFYDVTGRLTRQTAPDGSTREFGIDGSATVTDPLGRLVEQDFADGSKYTVASNGDLSFYDATGRLTHVDATDGSSVDYALDGAAYAYDTSGVLETVTPGVVAATLTTDAQLISLQRLLIVADGLGQVSASSLTGAPEFDARADTTSIVNPAISGTSQAGSALRLYGVSEAGVQLVGETTADAGGHWSIQPAPALQAGADLLTVVEVGPNGMAIASATMSLTVAVGTPPVPEISDILPPEDARGLLLVQGGGQIGEQVEVGYKTASGVDVVGYAQVNASGTWQIEVAEDALPFGSQQVSARALDGAGNVSAWSGAIRVGVADPEATAVHVGQDLRTKLETDSATGADATADLQTLADEASGSGQTLLAIPTGTYVLSHTVYLKSGSIIDSPGTSFVAAKTWQLPTAGSVEDATIHFAMFSNADWSGTGTPDSGIQFRNVSFNWLGTDSPGAAAVRILNAQNILVANCTFNGSNSGTAFEADDGAVVKDSVSYDTSEYGFDNWYGPKHTVIENNTVYSGWFGGISLTASPTSGTGAAQAVDNAVVGNSVYGFDRIGIDVNTLDADSTETGTLIANNYVSGLGRGIGVIGPTMDTLIADNTVLGSNQQAIEVENINPGSGSLDAQNAYVLGNMVGALDEDQDGVAAIVVQANGGSVAYNTVDGGTFPAAFWVPSNNLLLANNASTDNGVQQTATWWSSVISVEGMSVLPNSSVIGKADASVLSATAFSAPEGQGLIVTVPSVAGAVFTATAQLVGTVGEAQNSGVASPSGDGASGQPGTLTVFGSGNGDTINLGTGDDIVYIGGPNETIVAGGGNDTFYEGPTSTSANIDGGSGASQLILVPDEDKPNSFVLGDGIKDLASVKLVISGQPVSLTLNDIPFLQAYASDQGVAIIAGGPNQTIHMGQGVDIVTGWSGGSTTFEGNSLSFYGDTILNFRPTDVIDFTDMAPTAWWDVQADGRGGSYIEAYDGHLFSAVDTPALLSRSGFTAGDDGHHGLSIAMHS